MSQGWTHLVELSYKYWSLQLSQLLCALLRQENKEQKFFPKYSGKQNTFLQILFSHNNAIYFGKPEPKEKGDSLEYNTYKETNCFGAHRSPKQGRGQRNLGRRLAILITEGRRLSTVSSLSNTTSPTCPIKRHDFQSTIQKNTSVSSWQWEQRQEPPRRNPHPHNAHPARPQPAPTRKTKHLCPTPFLFFRSPYSSSSITSQTLGGRRSCPITPETLIWDAYLGHSTNASVLK